MQKHAASNQDESPERPPRLTAALAFGFAAGALFARKPAAALTAFATGVLTCVAASRKPLPTAGEATEASMPSPVSDTTAEEPATEQLVAVSKPFCGDVFGEMDPLPEVSDSKLPETADAADALLSLSLPDIGEQSPVAPDSNFREREQVPSHPREIREPFRELSAVASRKKSWLSWFR